MNWVYLYCNKTMDEEGSKIPKPIKCVLRNHVRNFPCSFQSNIWSNFNYLVIPNYSNHYFSVKNNSLNIFTSKLNERKNILLLYKIMIRLTNKEFILFSPSNSVVLLHWPTNLKNVQEIIRKNVRLNLRAFLFHPKVFFL